MLGRCKKDAFCGTYLFISTSFCVELKGWGSVQLEFRNFVCWFVQSYFNSNLTGRHPPATSPPHRRFWIPHHRQSHSKYVPPGYTAVLQATWLQNLPKFHTYTYHASKQSLLFFPSKCSPFSSLLTLSTANPAGWIETTSALQVAGVQNASMGCCARNPSFKVPS